MGDIRVGRPAFISGVASSLTHGLLMTVITVSLEGKDVELTAYESDRQQLIFISLGLLSALKLGIPPCILGLGD